MRNINTSFQSFVSLSTSMNEEIEISLEVTYSLTNRYSTRQWKFQ